MDAQTRSIHALGSTVAFSSLTLCLSGKDVDVTGEAISSKSVATDARNGDVDLTFANAPMSVQIQSQDGDARLATVTSQFSRPRD